MSRRTQGAASPSKHDPREWHTLSEQEHISNLRHLNSLGRSGSNVRAVHHHNNERETDGGVSIHKTYGDYDRPKALPSRGRDPGNHPQAPSSHPSTAPARPGATQLAVRGGILSTYSAAATSQQNVHGLARSYGGNDSSYHQIQHVGQSSPPSRNTHGVSIPDREHSEPTMPPHLRTPLMKRQSGAEVNRPRTEQGKREENAHVMQGKDAVSSEAHMKNARDAVGREPPLAMNAGLGTKSVKSEFPYPCTYSECTLGFKSSKQLVRHKKQQHDYCAICDKDFDDDVDLIQHRIDSTINQEGKHTACNICGDDFGSTAGRDAHMKLMHPSRQQITCPGCGTEFDRGANFVAHVWNNQCPDRSGLVSSEVMSKGRAYAALDLEKQEQVDRFGFSRLQDEELDDPGDLSVSGGVPVSRSLLDQLDDDFGSRCGEADVEEGSICGSAGSGQTIRPQVDRTVQQLAGYLEDFPPLTSDKPAKRGGEAPATKTAEPSQAFKSSERSVPRTVTGSILSGQRLAGTDWDDFPFERDFTEKYKCPFERCSAFYEDVATLKAHLVSGWHFGTDHRCVKCLKLFQNPVALIAHMESSSTRCNIRETQQYANLMYIISGGFLDIDEHGTLLDDNQLKLVSPTKSELITQHMERERARRDRESRLMARN